MKKIFFFIAFYSFGSILFSQNLPFPLPELQGDWERIYVQDMGSFDLPPSMEIQDGTMKILSQEINRKFGIMGPSSLILQPKGHNELDLNSFQTYSRILIKTTIGIYGDFDKIDFNIKQYNANDLKQFDILYNQQFTSATINVGMKLIKWYPLALETLNGMSIIHMKYLRDTIKEGESPVLVNVYYIHNNDRIHSLTMSYRITDENYWKPFFDAFLASFRISNIR
jgi:hypothetical protein